MQLCGFLFFSCLEVSIVFSQEKQFRYDDFFTDGALRINLVRTGNYHSSTIRIHSMFKETYWSGCKTKTIEPYDYGNYKIYVYDSSSNQLIFTRSWSSLFSEYIFTEKGRTEPKSFEEVVRIPFPRKTIKIIFFYRKNDIPIWLKQDSAYINPKHLVLDAPLVPHDMDVQKIIHAGKPENVMDIVIVADGYKPGEKQKFIQDAKRVIQYLLHCKPYKEFRKFISAWTVFIPMSVSDSMLCSFNTLGIDRYLMTERVFLLHDYISQIPYDFIILLINTDVYGGGGIYNFYATCPSDNPYTNFLVIHETGHSIAGLADEYWTSEVSVKNFYNLNYEPWEPNITTLVSFEKKWSSMVKPKTPIPTPAVATWEKEIGVFEGGGYSEKGIYRPSYDCSMKSPIYDNFCKVCQEAIKKVIRFYIN
ncbi:MAG: IgA Peptidase M64 [Bacteroidales bacterium]|nr:IgA Peptidase M64 [Bacteroidales bacterium]